MLRVVLSLRVIKAYAWWEIRWRRNGETRWMTRRIPKNSLNYVLSLLAGEYEVGVRLTGASQSSPWSIPVYVSNAATGGEKQLALFSVSNQLNFLAAKYCEAVRTVVIVNLHEQMLTTVAAHEL